MSVLCSNACLIDGVHTETSVVVYVNAVFALVTQCPSVAVLTEASFDDDIDDVTVRTLSGARSALAELVARRLLHDLSAQKVRMTTHAEAHSRPVPAVPKRLILASAFMSRAQCDTNAMIQTARTLVRHIAQSAANNNEHI